MANDFITVEEIAQQRGCSVKTVKRYVEKGLLPPLPPQKGLHKQGWPAKVWDKWHEKQAKVICRGNRSAHVNA